MNKTMTKAFFTTLITLLPYWILTVWFIVMAIKTYNASFFYYICLFVTILIYKEYLIRLIQITKYLYKSCYKKIEYVKLYDSVLGKNFNAYEASTDSIKDRISELEEVEKLNNEFIEYDKILKSLFEGSKIPEWKK